MNDVEKLAELDRKLVELKKSLAERVQRLTERAAAPLDRLEEGLIPALKHGEITLRETVQRYPLGSVAAAVAAGAATTMALRRASVGAGEPGQQPSATSTMWHELEPYWAVAGEAMRSLGIAAAAGVVEGALRVVDARRQDTATGTARGRSRGNLSVVTPESSPPGAEETLARPL